MQKTGCILMLCCASILSYSQRAGSDTLGFMELSCGQLYSKDKPVLIEVPNMGGSFNFNGMGKRGFRSAIEFDLLLQPDMKFRDAMFGNGLGFAPFKKILLLNFDYCISYGILGLNNFSGLLKSYAILHVPVFRKSTRKFLGLDLTLGGGYYYRYSYKLFGYWGKEDGLYAKPKGYFFQAGLAFIPRFDR